MRVTPSLFDDDPGDPDDRARARLQPRWDAVDAYLEDALVPGDAALTAALDASAAAELPSGHVTAAQGQMLHLMALAVGARRILEVGTLGGVGTIWLARALAADGELVTLEVSPRHAAVAQANIDRAGVGDRVDIRVGPAAEELAVLRREAGAPFDLVFVDADAASCAVYVAHALALSRPGTVILVAGTVRAGTVADETDPDPDVRGVRRLHAALATEPRLCATALQTVGARGWDGITMAVVGA